MMVHLEECFPERYKIEYQRNNADYVYLCEKLENLSDKKYHGKKNFINRFRKTYEDWNYELISDENTEECVRMTDEWCGQNGCGEVDKGKSDEVCNLIGGLKNRKKHYIVEGNTAKQEKTL